MSKAERLYQEQLAKAFTQYDPYRDRFTEQMLLDQYKQMQQYQQMQNTATSNTLAWTGSSTSTSTYPQLYNTGIYLDNNIYTTQQEQAKVGSFIAPKPKPLSNVDWLRNRVNEMRVRL